MAPKWRVLLAVCFGTYLATMDFSIVNVALPTLADDFDVSPNTVVWATLAYSLSVTGLTLTAGRAGDLWGRKRVYLAGWAVFTLGLVGASVAQTLPQLVLTRIVQAIGGSLTMANGNALVTSAFPDSERGRALGTNGAVVGAGLMSGPLLGGVILDALDWQAIFYLRAPAGLFALAAGWLVIHEKQEPLAMQRRLDIPGAVLLFFALAASLLALNRGQPWGWHSPIILGLFIVGGASLVGFLAVERRVASPVVSLALFRVRAYGIGVLSLALNFAGQATTTFLMPFYLINVRGYSTFHAGVIITTVPAMMLLLSPLSGYISDRFAFRHQATAGLALVALGLFLLSTIGAGTPDALVVARLLVVGIGTASFMSPNSSEIMGSVSRAMLGTASASVATARNIGNATGLAVASTVVVVVAHHVSGAETSSLKTMPPTALLDGIRAAFLVAGGISSTAIVASLFRPRRHPIAHVQTVEPAPLGGR